MQNVHTKNNIICLNEHFVLQRHLATIHKKVAFLGSKQTLAAFLLIHGCDAK